MKRLWACSLQRDMEEEKMKYDKAEILVMQYKAAFAVPYFGLPKFTHKASRSKLRNCLKQRK